MIKRILILFLFFGLLGASIHTYKLVNDTGDIINLTFNTNAEPDSYIDAGSNPNAHVIVCANSSSELLNKFIVVAYSNPNETSVFKYASLTQQIIDVNSSNCSDIDVDIQSHHALFPGRVFVVIANDSDLTQDVNILETDQYFLGFINATTNVSGSDLIVNITTVIGCDNDSNNHTINYTNPYFVVSLIFENGTVWNTTMGAMNSNISLPRPPNSTVLYINGFPINTTDTFPPFVNITYPDNDTYGDRDYDLNYTVSDESGVDQCWYSLDGNANITLPNCNNTTLTNLSNGQHCVIVFANDTYGNIGNDSVCFTVNRSINLDVWIEPQIPNNDTNLTCYINLNTTSPNATINYTWYVNNIKVKEGSFIGTNGLNEANLTQNYSNYDEVSCFVSVYDEVTNASSFDAVYIYNDWPMYGRTVFENSFNPTTGPDKNQTIWQSLVMEGRTVIVGDYVYGLNSNELYKKYLSNGSDVWRITWPNDGCDLLFVNNTIYVLTHDGILGYNTTGNLTYNMSFNVTFAEDSSNLLLYDGYFILKSASNLSLINKTSKQVIWQNNYSTTTTSSAVVKKRVIYFVQNNTVYAIGIDGIQLWNYTLPNIDTYNPVVDDYVYIATNGTLFAFDRENGTLVWNYSQNVSTYGIKLALYNDTILFGANGTLVFLNKTNGNEIKQFSYGNNKLNQLVVSNNLIYLFQYGDTQLKAYDFDGNLVWTYDKGDLNYFTLKDSYLLFYSGDTTITYAVHVQPLLDKVYVDIKGHENGDGTVYCYAITNTTSTVNYNLYIDGSLVESGSKTVYSNMPTILTTHTTNVENEFDSIYCTANTGGDSVWGWAFTSYHWPMKRHVISGDSGSLGRLDNETRVLWSKSINGNGTGVIFNNISYVFSKENKTLYAFNLMDGSQIWNLSFDNTTNGEILYYNDSIFIAVNNSLFSINASDGNILWNKTIVGEGKYLNIYHNLLVISKSSNISVFNLSTNTFSWEKEVGKITKHPIIYGGYIFVANNTTLVRLDIFTGSQAVKNYSSQIDLVASDNKLFIISGDTLHTTNPFTLDELWNTTLSNDLEEIAFLNNTIFTLSPTNIQAVNISDNGSIIWTYAVTSAKNLLISKNYVLYSKENETYALNINNGSYAWNVSLNETINDAQGALYSYYYMLFTNTQVFVLSRSIFYNVTIWIDTVETTNFSNPGRPQNLTVRVLDKFGQPIEGLRIMLKEKDGNSIFLTKQGANTISVGIGSLETDTNGFVSLAVIPTGYSVGSTYNLTLEVYDERNALYETYQLNLNNTSFADPQHLTVLPNKNDVSNMLTKLSLVLTKTNNFNNNNRGLQYTLNTSNSGDINLSNNTLYVNIPTSFIIKGESNQKIQFNENNGNLLFVAPQLGVLSIGSGNIILNSSGEGILTIVPTGYSASNYNLTLEIYDTLGNKVNETTFNINTASTSDYYDTGEEILNRNYIANTITNALNVVANARGWINA